MTGDRHHSCSKVMRWINAFQDGCKHTTSKGKTHIPSLTEGKRYERRRRRHRESESVHIECEEIGEGNR
jgi:hypothetical protein